jgi:hypothetical protein
MTGQNAPAKIAVRPSIEKAADTEASASATMNEASLTGIIERRVITVSGMSVTLTASATVGVTSVTLDVTGVVAIIASALRRIKPAFSHAFNRRPVRILFQPHRRPSSAALAVTTPSGWERSQAKACISSNGRVGGTQLSVLFMNDPERTNTSERRWWCASAECRVFTAPGCCQRAT